MGRARPGLLRNAVGSLGVLGIVAFFAFGLPLIDRSMPADRPVAGNAPFRVGAGVSVLPPPGASIDLTRTRPDDDRGTAVFVVGGVRLQVVVAPFRGDLDEAARKLRAKIARSSGYRVTGRERGVTTQARVTGLRGAYASPGRLGEYAVFAHDGLAVEITASGPEDRLRASEPLLDTPLLDDSLRSLAFGGPRS
jgi:hypothetical protein